MTIRNAFLGIFLVLLGFIVGHIWSSNAAYAQLPGEYFLRREWGQFRTTTSSGQLVFEDDAGVIRIINPRNFDPITKVLSVDLVFSRR
jgi:hypothetical protein